MLNTTVGRFLTRDPEGLAAGNTNLYRFVNNEPTNYTDPSGLEEEGFHHPYPLYLGGDDRQMQIHLTKAEHTAAHDVFRKLGPNRDAQRKAWELLSAEQRSALITKALKAAKLPDKVAERLVLCQS